MPYACIDIGSNTTRLLVAEPEPGAPGALRVLAARRDFTLLGGEEVKPDTEGPLDRLGRVVAAQAAEARALGAVVSAVVTAPGRGDAGGAIARALREACGIEVALLTHEEEARYAFSGATRLLEPDRKGDVLVADVGGGSTELARGRPGSPPEWSASFPLGSGRLTGDHARSDPATPREFDRMRAAVGAALAGLELPPPGLALAVGGSATSLRWLVGGSIGAEEIAGALALLGSAPAEAVARAHGLAPERARLLPAGLVVLEALARRLRCSFEIAPGGLREGVVLALAAEAASGEVAKRHARQIPTMPGGPG